MRSERPLRLNDLRRDRMHQVPAATMQIRMTSARTVLRQAHAFRSAAAGNLADGLTLPAISAPQQAARLAITAVAAIDGFRSSNTAGAHEAVVDYAYSGGLVDRLMFTQLDQLRELRHQVNYPADMIEPSAREVEQFSTLVDAVMTAAAGRFPARKIPPPPTTTP